METQEKIKVKESRPAIQPNTQGSDSSNGASLRGRTVKITTQIVLEAARRRICTDICDIFERNFKALRLHNPESSKDEESQLREYLEKVRQAFSLLDQGLTYEGISLATGIPFEQVSFYLDSLITVYQVILNTLEKEH
jgi:hypothetical protein